jgi:pentatricopeptide repeat protein
MTPKQDVVTWTSMITAFAHDENFEKALDFFIEFLSIGKEPDQFALSSAMNACAALSLPATCKQLHCYTVKSGLDQFTVCGNSQIAMYRNIGDVKASKKTFDQITILDTYSWSTMVLTYAVHGHENEALELLQKMKECGVMIDNTAFLAALIACSQQGLMDEGFRYMLMTHLSVFLFPKSLAFLLRFIGILVYYTILVALHESVYSKCSIVKSSCTGTICTSKGELTVWEL